MTQVDIATNEWLSELCPDSPSPAHDQLRGVPDCPRCQGTGKRHPWAYVKCNYGRIWKPESKAYVHGIDCDCDGAGFVLEVTLEKVLTLPRLFQVHLYDRRTGWEIEMLFSSATGSGYSSTYRGFGETLLAASLDALRQVNDA